VVRQSPFIISFRGDQKVGHDRKKSKQAKINSLVLVENLEPSIMSDHTINLDIKKALKQVNNVEAF
jgi:hypothetical protein